tara:strand:- start:21 stop:464 length:444 start_codon:yes stop_codon:yes gene_type:complete
MIVSLKEHTELIELHTALLPFYEKMPYRKKALNEDKWAFTWLNLIETGVGKVLALLDKDDIIGGIGLINSPSLEDGALVVQEAFWFVDEKHRGGGIKLFRAAEKYTKQIGAERLMMIHLETSMPEKLKKFYKAMNYKLAETTYIKEF